jgi:amino acid adenylation domain-containing protein
MDKLKSEQGKQEIWNAIRSAVISSRKGLLMQRVSRDGVLPLSFAQQRLWFLAQLQPNSSAYNIPVAYYLMGVLKIATLEQSLNEILHRHEALRTTFLTVNGQPTSQKIAPSTTSLTLPIIDIYEHPETERKALAQQIVIEEARQPFDLTNDLLFRVKLLRLAKEEYVLLLNMHHIISDGWSFDVFFSELTALYTAFSHSQPSPLPELSIQYADFAYWQREWLQGEVLESQLNYWKQQLGGILPILQLPINYPRPPVLTYQGAYQYLELSKDLTEALKVLSQQEGVTLFMTLLAAFQTLLFRYSGQEDIIVGTPIAGRNQVKTDGLIGFFVNTLVMRTDLSGKPSFRQLLARVREVALGAYAHQNLPFEKLVEKLQPERNLSRSPLFQVMFAFQNTPGKPWELPGLTITPLEVHSGTSKFDLTLDLKETSKGIKGGIEYNTDLFDSATITRMVGHFQTLLEGIVTNPEQHLWDLPLLTFTEQHQLLVEWNDTRADYPSERCIHQLFEAQVDRTPDAIAVVFEDKKITYRELNERANQLAHYLQQLGVKPEVLVGICVERALSMLVTILGILKVGAAYVPLDPAYPQERLYFMLADAKVPVLLTQKNLLETLPEHSAKVVCIDAEWKEISRESDRNPAVKVEADRLAYVLYTSGSTGTPKGVLGTHRGTVNRCFWNPYPFIEQDICCQKTSLNFADSVWEIFAPLLHGLPTVIIPDRAVKDINQFLQTLSNRNVTRLVLVPSLLRAILDSFPDLDRRLPQLKYWICSGETLSVELCQQFREQMPQRVLINLYGSSEVAADVTWYDATHCVEKVPIGRPIANTQIYLLDRNLQPVPIGIPGEIYVGGDGLARSYLNRKNLTEEKFICNSFLNSKFKIQKFKGDRLYKTGDLARYLPDGNIEFLGRIDNQVKIRGFRIELREVESTLSQYPTVQQCVVTARVDYESDKYLVAYIVSNQQQKPTTDELRCFLKQKLPDYMVPSAFVFPDALPLTPNGKIDRRALPAPDRLKLEPASTFVAPSDDLEIQLTKIWENVLGKKPISVKDNFFDVGGHSLLAVRLFAQIEKTFGKNLPLATLFQAPNIEELANILRQKGWSASWQTLVAIQPDGFKPPFFCVHGGGDNVISYGTLARYLGSDQPLYGLQTNGLDGKQAPLSLIEDIATHYIKAILTLQPSGPYFLGGHCFGSFIAFEMAQQLVAMGQKVALLALFESNGPNTVKITFSDRVYFHLMSLMNHSQMGFKEKLDYLRKRVSWHLLTNRRIPTPIRKAYSNVHSMQGSPQAPYILDILEANLQASSNYVVQAYPGRVTLFRASWGNPIIHSTRHRGWGDVANGGVEVYDIPGDQMTLFKEPSVQVLAEKLRTCLDRAIADASEAHTSEQKKLTTEVEHQVSHLSNKGLSALWSSLVPIHPHGSRRPFFGVHTNDGSVLFYRHLVRHLHPDQPFYGLQAPALDGKQAPRIRIEELAAHYIKEIQTIQPEGPYLLGGFCIGGVIAFEMAQQLVEKGQQVALLALFDAFAPFPLSLRNRVSLHLGYFSFLEPQEKLTYLQAGFKRRIKLFSQTIQKIPQKFFPSIDSFDTGIPPLRLSPYTPQVYPSRVTLFRASKQSPITYHLPDLGWGKLTSVGVEVHDIPGSHTEIVLCEPAVEILAEKLQACMDKAQTYDAGVHHP